MTQERFGEIYIIRNTKNGKVYIGQTTMRYASKRWAIHIYQLRNNRHRNRHLQSAYNKQNESDFIFESIHVAFSQDELDMLEEQYIQDLNALDPQYGYNLKHGGSRGKHTDEQKKRLSEIHTGKRMSQKTREKMRQITKSRWEDPEYRVQMTQMSREKQSSDVFRTSSSRRCGFNGCWLEHPEYGKQWCETINGFGRLWGINPGHLSELINGKRKTLYRWRISAS